ncbi:hypothetical protein LXT21_07925 [Myxococcus sp. K38C18041901]|uniref:hypothetical protein n=1 Tax=Myxococcus guangdongensis TaxID=2906760 RepID=UPI0020A80311|nr:hypothetical protein [Myxococcus guangdongensis]MCP3058695.1 hypothetical protein [Myxococcus guangdongensis]
MKLDGFARVLPRVALLLAVACQHSALAQEQLDSAPKTLTQQVLTPVGTTYPYTQQLQWLDSGRFIVGRLDGSMTLFRPPGPTEWGPMLTDVLRTPANRGVEMMAVRDERTFVTSNDSTTLTLWRERDLAVAEDAEPALLDRLPRAFRYQNFAYDADVGTANSAVFVTHGNREYLVTGHENGFVLIWSVSRNGRQLAVLKKIDVRSPDPIPSPFQLWNVRDIVSWRDGVVITGSEDGDLVMLQLPQGTVLARKRYNPSAQRGINGLALLDDHLVAVACSVGPSDKNTWLFRVRPAELQSQGSVDLKQNLSLPQSFAFRAAMASVGGQPHVFATTQEGLLWTVLVTPEGQLQVQAVSSVDFPIGEAIDYNPATSQLAAVGVLVNLFNVAPPTPAQRQQVPKAAPPQAPSLVH